MLERRVIVRTIPMSHAENKVTQPDGASPALCSGDLFGWLREKLAAAEKSLEARKQAAECWRDGTNKAWRAVGNRMTKAQRLAQAEVELRIAAKYQRDVDNYRAVIAALPNP